MCLETDTQYIMAPYEADAQISFLMKKGHVDLVISEDSDILAFGCAKYRIQTEEGGCKLDKS